MPCGNSPGQNLNLEFERTIVDHGARVGIVRHRIDGLHIAVVRVESPRGCTLFKYLQRSPGV